jgi:diguanylate cyclase (GGDEF)-like protein
MLVKNSKPEEAAAIAEKIRYTTESGVESGMGKVTVSLGIANIMQGESCEQWVARADAAMYRAKQLGRNRVEL